MRSISKLIVSASAGIALLGIAIIPVAAQTGGATTSPQDLRNQLRAQVREARDEQRVDFEKRREELRQQIEERRNAAKESLQTAREAIRAKIAKDRETMRAKIKDERKKEIAIRVNDQLNHLNERWTTHFANALDQLRNVLGKVRLRMEKAEANGINIDSVKVAIEAAEAAINTANQANEVQVNKTYSATFNTEDAIKQAMRDARQLLRSDLTTLRDGAMKNARQAVQNAIQSLGGISRVNEDMPTNSTSSAATSTQ